MATPSPYRSLPAERRITLLAHALGTSREARLAYAQRLASRKGGFRAQAVASWPADKIAREIVRQNAETPQDELDLLQLLYVDLEPAIQITMLDTAGVKHENGRIDEESEPPYTDEAGTERAAAAVHAAHGDEGMRYLRTLVRYGREGWPGIERVVAGLEG